VKGGEDVYTQISRGVRRIRATKNSSVYGGSGDRQGEKPIRHTAVVQLRTGVLTDTKLLRT